MQSPDNPVLLNNLAVLYQAKGNPKAVETAERAYNAAPKAAGDPGHLRLDPVRERQERQGAGVCSSEAAKGMPDNAEVQYHYAAALAKKGDTAEAVALLKKAVNGQMPASAKADAQKLLQQLSK